MSISPDEFVPSCWNCLRWKHIKREWGHCSSKQFRLTDGGKILTKKTFQCIDYDMIYTNIIALGSEDEEEDEEENCEDTQLEKNQKAKITGIFC